MLKELKKEKLESLTIKLSNADRDACQAKANKHAGGNLSAWLRYAGKNYEPSKKELQ